MPEHSDHSDRTRRAVEHATAAHTAGRPTEPLDPADLAELLYRDRFPVLDATLRRLETSDELPPIPGPPLEEP